MYKPGELQFIATSTYRRAPIFRSEGCYQHIVQRLEEVRQKFRCLLIGWVLIRRLTGFHLRVKPQSAESRPRMVKEVKEEAGMGGMGFIERLGVECLRSILSTAHLIEAAYQAGVQRYLFSSPACAYNIELQQDSRARALKESDAYPAMAERGYGWEKLMSEMFCQECCAERGIKTLIAPMDKAYGPARRR
jgi:hypothetical protein